MVICTKLVQWLSLAALVLSLWAAFLSETIPVSPQLYYQLVMPVSLMYVRVATIIMPSLPLQFPVYLVLCCGVSCSEPLPKSPLLSTVALGTGGGLPCVDVQWLPPGCCSAEEGRPQLTAVPV